MSTIGELPLQLFDSDADVYIVERRLPHWSQPGTVAFITWRTADSMPKAVLDGWFDDRGRSLIAHGIDPESPQWRQQLATIDRRSAQAFLNIFWNRWHDALDECHGQCVLRQPALANIVAQSLRHFENDRYLLLDFVVMPNHVHVLVAFPNEDTMLDQCESWKHYTATQLNRRLGRKGRFWQQDGFDHLVRSEEQFDYLRRYIADNPARARLAAGEYLHFSKQL
jgi:REP element-mobilizing transposase RayT